jgi:RNA-directed DNA polymerase
VLHGTDEAGEPDQRDPVEGRRHREKEEPFERPMKETLSSQLVSTKLERIAELAKRMPGTKLTTLAHHIDMDWLRVAFEHTRKDGATGVDGQGAEQYKRDLEGNLKSLLERAKSGTYRAPPVRRVHIPKGDGRTRPLGIPTFEDKILQRGVAMVLESIYEQDFLDCSYGFRPKRSAHDALTKLRDATMAMGGGWMVEVDIERFFDTIDHALLRAAIQRRIGDGVILRLIGKWLHAGVMEGAELSYPESGTPQGGVISPILANIFLHEVLDVWFHEEVLPTLKGAAVLVRYADDFVILFKEETDAREAMNVLPRRFEQYGLKLHPTKTKLVPFQKPPSRPDPPKVGRGTPGPGTFNLLGFTHFWTQSKRGYWVVMLKTAKDRLTRAAKKFGQWCQTHRHLAVEDQRKSLNRKLRGFFAYFGIVGNRNALWTLRQEVYRRWRDWLNRRSNRARVTWARMQLIEEHHPLIPIPTELRQLRT